MIILEGPDGAGKTTLATQLNKHFDLPIAPKIVASNTESIVESKKAWCERNVSDGFQVSLFDRHCLISEPIYNSIFRKAFDPGFDNFSWLFNMSTMFYLCNPLVIYCLPSYEAVRENVMGDPDNEAVVHKIRRIYAQYVAKAAVDCSQHSAMIYDYTSPLHTLSSIFNAVEKAVERQAHV